MAATREVRVGTSGWVYDHWKERFYPKGLPSSRWLPFYAERFDTVELNGTFYRWPKDETFAAWKSQVPGRFTFAVKASRYLTHRKKLNDPEEPLQRIFGGVKHLGRQLGPVLFQLPPRWRRNPERLAEFFRHLPPRIRHVLEFRDADWLHPDVFRLMKRHRVSLCVHDILPDHPRDVAGPIVYVRFHGRTGRPGGEYKPSDLRPWLEWLRDVRKRYPVWSYFNNDVDGHALRNAVWLRDRLA